MNSKYRNLLFFLTALCLPFLTLISPNWLKIYGVSPCWPILWLLPFSLKNGPVRALLAGILLGLLMDSFTMGGASFVPSFLLLSLWWGGYGLQEKRIDLGLNLGLMAMFGTTLVGFSIWVQKISFQNFLIDKLFNNWAIHTLIAEVTITGLLAPILCSWLLLTYRKNYKNNFKS